MKYIIVLIYIINVQILMWIHICKITFSILIFQMQNVFYTLITAGSRMCEGPNWWKCLHSWPAHILNMVFWHSIEFYDLPAACPDNCFSFCWFLLLFNLIYRCFGNKDLDWYELVPVSWAAFPLYTFKPSWISKPLLV
jgi:hypothetical protein